MLNRNRLISNPEEANLPWEYVSGSEREKIKMIILSFFLAKERLFNGFLVWILSAKASFNRIKIIKTRERKRENSFALF